VTADNIAVVANFSCVACDAVYIFDGETGSAVDVASSSEKIHRRAADWLPFRHFRLILKVQTEHSKQRSASNWVLQKTYEIHCY